MATMLTGQKVFENDIVVVYQVSEGDDQAMATEVAVISKKVPETWNAFGASKDIAGLIYARAYRTFQSSGEWPPQVYRQS